jgi:hypothetical protein
MHHPDAAGWSHTATHVGSFSNPEADLSRSERDEVKLKSRNYTPVMPGCFFVLALI